LGAHSCALLLYQALSEKDFTEDSVVQDAIKFCSEAETINRPLAQAPRIKNSYIVGQDDTFLGEVSSSQVAAKSICNQVGKYGSQVATTSIRNQVAKYGNQVSKLSAYNPYAQNPPILIQDGQPVAVLTKNPNIEGGLDPDLFFYQTCQQAN